MGVKHALSLIRGKSIGRIIKTCCGEKIGSGSCRDVYAFKQYPEYVIKIERDPSGGDFANVCEWKNWVNHRQWNLIGEWLAPCIAINETGQVLVQRRVRPGRRKDYPKYIPVLLTDLKLENFGWIGKKFVCCDYPMLIMPEPKKKMKYAKWWVR